MYVVVKDQIIHIRLKYTWIRHKNALIFSEFFAILSISDIYSNLITTDESPLQNKTDYTIDFPVNITRISFLFR